MEANEKLPFQIHGIISDSDSDTDNKNDFNEKYKLLKPPPFCYEMIKDNIVKISPRIPETRNVWEERLKTIAEQKEKNDEIIITKRKKMKKSKKNKNKALTLENINSSNKIINIRHDIESLHRKSSLYIKESNMNISLNDFPTLSQNTPKRKKNVNNKLDNSFNYLEHPKQCVSEFNISQLGDIERILDKAKIKNVWHQGLDESTIQKTKLKLKQKEDKMYRDWLEKCRSLENTLDNSILQEPTRNVIINNDFKIVGENTTKKCKKIKIRDKADRREQKDKNIEFANFTEGLYHKYPEMYQEELYHEDQSHNFQMRDKENDIREIEYVILSNNFGVIKPNKKRKKVKSTKDLKATSKKKKKKKKTKGLSQHCISNDMNAKTKDTTKIELINTSIKNEEEKKTNLELTRLDKIDFIKVRDNASVISYNFNDFQIMGENTTKKCKKIKIKDKADSHEQKDKNIGKMETNFKEGLYHKYPKMYQEEFYHEDRSHNFQMRDKQDDIREIEYVLLNNNFGVIKPNKKRKKVKNTKDLNNLSLREVNVDYFPETSICNHKIGDNTIQKTYSDYAGYLLGAGSFNCKYNEEVECTEQNKFEIKANSKKKKKKKNTKGLSQHCTSNDLDAKTKDTTKIELINTFIKNEEEKKTNLELTRLDNIDFVKVQDNASVISYNFNEKKWCSKTYPDSLNYMKYLSGSGEMSRSITHPNINNNKTKIKNSYSQQYILSEIINNDSVLGNLKNDQQKPVTDDFTECLPSTSSYNKQKDEIICTKQYTSEIKMDSKKEKLKKKVNGNLQQSTLNAVNCAKLLEIKECRQNIFHRTNLDEAEVVQAELNTSNNYFDTVTECYNFDKCKKHKSVDNSFQLSTFLDSVNKKLEMGNENSGNDFLCPVNYKISCNIHEHKKTFQQLNKLRDEIGCFYYEFEGRNFAHFMKFREVYLCKSLEDGTKKKNRQEITNRNNTEEDGVNKKLEVEDENNGNAFLWQVNCKMNCIIDEHKEAFQQLNILKGEIGCFYYEFEGRNFTHFMKFREIYLYKSLEDETNKKRIDKK